ncbi:MAG: glucose-6-phosphate dehydrogenase, partial [Candidatus Eremiobacteraeota bacterium]|nr:glucose-6-phosphate dehydrogenase [Candidatus Eremiobacteraeota bacterium]
MATTELVNPFRQGLREDRATRPVQLVIFGASGDLTTRKLLPALYNLVQAELVPENFCVVGFARNEMTDDEYRATLRASVAKSGEVRVRDEHVVDDLAARTRYLSGTFDDAGAFARLRAVLDENDAKYGTDGNRIFYVSTPASLFG